MLCSLVIHTTNYLQSCIYPEQVVKREIFFFRKFGLLKTLQKVRSRKKGSRLVGSARLYIIYNIVALKVSCVALF